MIETRADRESLETQTLAPWAALSEQSLGRKYPEIKASRRAEYQRDCDRIINSRCFRRLEYKTQVFVIGTEDHYRTRLTHTMEMTQVARALARALRVNEDLAAAISLAHDIGHSPFGHSGEHELDRPAAPPPGARHTPVLPASGSGDRSCRTSGRRPGPRSAPPSWRP